MAVVGMFDRCAGARRAALAGKGGRYVNHIEYQFEFENPFNVEAEWICYLKELDSGLFYKQDLRKTAQPARDPEMEVKRFFQSLPHICNGELLLRSGVPMDEKQAVQKWEHYGEFSYMLRFLSMYTEQLTGDRILSSSYFKAITCTPEGVEIEFESLNTNVEETGLLILPELRTINDPLPSEEEEEMKEQPSAAAEREAGGPSSAKRGQKKHWAADRVPGIQDELSHTYYVETEKLVCGGSRYRVANTVLRRHLFTENKKAIRIAVCPVAHKDLLEIKTYCEERGGQEQRLCSAEGLKCGRFVHNKVRASLFLAGENRADLAVFPEMLGDEEIVSPAFFAHVREEMRGRKCAMPSLVLLPTRWHDHCNELHVVDAAGKRLCIQQKQTPYLFMKKEDGQLYAEDLREPEPVIHIVHVPELGRFTFPICKDFLNEEYVQMMLRWLRATFLLCPSYSPSKKQFDLTAYSGMPYGCYTVWCNTCAAYWEDKLPQHIGLAAGPQAPDKPLCLLVPNPGCDRNCEDEKSACMFLVEISMDRSAEISCRHICG